MEHKYYLLYRIKEGGEWKSLYFRSFLTTNSDRNIYGQFISSSWFNMAITNVSKLEMAVVRLTNEFVSNMSHDSICELLYRAESDATIGALEFVVAYDVFEIGEVKKRLEELVHVKGDISRASYQDQRKSIGATFGIQCTEKAKYEYTVCCPSFIIAKN